MPKSSPRSEGTWVSLCSATSQDPLPPKSALCDTDANEHVTAATPPPHSRQTELSVITTVSSYKMLSGATKAHSEILHLTP